MFVVYNCIVATVLLQNYST